uniref:Si:ch211-225h24.2 n=1 Tax=Paramormyrops kingsleyae TaxID=1676925 RepID=A0A3B3RVA6_9TELE
MFKRSKSQVLVDDTPEEDEEVQWHRRHMDELKVKIIRSKKDKKLFSSEDDEHSLLTGVTPSEARRSAKKSKEEDKRTYLEKGQCFWDSVTMTMKQITPTKKMGKLEGWEPPTVGEMTHATEEHMAGDTLIRHDEALPWTDLEGDLSKYASLSGPRGPGPRWTTKAKDKLASIRRRSLSENWEGLK